MVTLRNKRLFIIAITLLISTLYAKEGKISLSAGLTSGGIFYSSPEVKGYLSEVGNALPFNIGSNIYVNLNPKEQISFFAGTDILFSVNSKNKLHYNNFIFSISYI